MQKRTLGKNPRPEPASSQPLTEKDYVASTPTTPGLRLLAVLSMLMEFAASSSLV